MIPYTGVKILSTYKTKPKHYVYALLDPRRPGKFYYDTLNVCFLFEPFYIGKGKGTRVYSHTHEAFKQSPPSFKKNKIRKIMAETGKKPIAVILHKDLTDSRAISKEMSLIKKIGRYNRGKGPLTNLTDGGEGMSGWKHSARSKKLIIESNKRRMVTESTKNKISESVKKTDYHPSKKIRKRMSRRVSGKNNPFFGKRFIGPLNHNYGKELPGYQKRILSDLAKERKGDRNPNSKYVYCLIHVDGRNYHNVYDLAGVTGEKRFRGKGFLKSVTYIECYGWKIYRKFRAKHSTKNSLCPCQAATK
jgi:hypothetical protein